MTVKVWGRATSTNVQKVLWLCSELDLQIEHQEVGGSFGGLDTPEFGAMNPNRTVPVIEHDDLVVWESHAILRYLASVFLTKGIYPTEPSHRSHDDRWLDWHSNVFWPPIRTLFLQGFRDGTLDLESDQAALLFEQVERSLALIEDALPKATPGKRKLRLAHIPIAIGLNRLLTVRPDFPLPNETTHWLEETMERPGFATVRRAEDQLRSS